MPEIVEGDYVRVLFYTVNLLISVINYTSQGPLKTYEHHSSLGRQEVLWMKKIFISPEKTVVLRKPVGSVLLYPYYFSASFFKQNIRS